MFVGEFNTDNLAYLLLGICINSDKNQINKETEDIIKSDLVKFRPSKLYHAYTLKDFTAMLTKFKENNLDLILREIIPNNYGVGLVREMGFKNTSVSDLLSSIMKQFKYYCIVKDNKNDSSFIVSYNPEMMTMKKIKMKLCDDLTVCFNVMQTGVSSEAPKGYEMISCQQSPTGTLLVYDVDFDDLKGERFSE